MSRAAFITGITGQDGSYLTELLLSKHYAVTGVRRRLSTGPNLQRLSSEVLDNENLTIEYGDVVDGTGMSRLIREWSEKHKTCEQLEIYHLAAQSHVQVSFELPDYTRQTNIGGTYNLLNAVVALPLELRNKVRFYHASSSEMFGLVQEVPQRETTPFYPRSPYAVSKLAGHWGTINYRESYNLFACCGILFNHESPRRGENFVTRKITKQVGEIKRGERECIELGNLDAKRDWGHARDYVEAMWLILQKNEPEDFVIATGNQYSVREFVEKAFATAMGAQINWQGEGLEEIGVDGKNASRILVRVNQRFFRPAEVETLLGDAAKARKHLKWAPKVSCDELVKEMVDADCNAILLK